VHVVNSFDLIVALPYPRAAALFGPEGERPWAGPHWEPHFIYPQPAHDRQGAVFTIAHGDRTAVWVNTLFDLDARHFQYVYVVPEIQAATIDVTFRSIDASHTAVHVTYARTALTSDANDHILALGEQDQTSGPEWQSAINAFLKKSAAAQ
jgi:hypothetical protein